MNICQPWLVDKSYSLKYQGNRCVPKTFEPEIIYFYFKYISFFIDLGILYKNLLHPDDIFE